MKKNYPIILVLVLSLLAGVFTLTDYGESWDDLSLQKYARRSLAAYSTWAQHGVLEISAETLGNYGPAYVMAVALAVRPLSILFPINPSDLRHFFYLLTYLAGMAAFYALGLRWLTRRAALGATLLFMTQPVFWGHAFMNPKDTPFLAFFLLSIWAGFKMVDEVQPPLFHSLTSSAKKILVLLTTLWLGSVFSAFLFTPVIQTALTSLVQSAHSGAANIIAFIASDVQTAAPEIYIQKYFTLFLHARAFYFLFSTIILLYFYSRLLPSALRVFSSVLLPALLLGFTSSIRILGPFAALLVVYYALRVQGKKSLPMLLAYAVLALIAMYLTWPYLWANPIGHLWQSFETMSAYPWQGVVLYNGIRYAATDLPRSYLPVLLAIQLSEPVWALTLAGAAAFALGGAEKKKLIELSVLWFLIPLAAFILLHSALYDNFRQIIFILPPVFWAAGAAFEKIKDIKWQTALIAVCLLPGIVGGIRLHPYEYIYYNSFIGGMNGAADTFELDYWAISYREAAEYVNAVAPQNSIIWVEGPAQLFEMYARKDLKIYSDHEVERAAAYDYVVATTRYKLHQASYPTAPIVYTIARANAALTVIKQP